MTGTKLPGIRKALSDALTSEAFLEEAGITRAAAEEAMALCRWEEALPTLFPVTGRYTCRQLFDQCSDAMNFLSPEPEGGWMPFTYRFVCHILYPEADFTESAAPYRAGAILYLTVLRFFFDEERKVVPLTRWWTMPSSLTRKPAASTSMRNTKDFWAHGTGSLSTR